MIGMLLGLIVPKGKLIVVALILAEPRRTVTPPVNSATYHWIVVGAVSLAPLVKVTAVPVASNCPDTKPLFGAVLTGATLNIRKDWLGVTAVESVVLTEAAPVGITLVPD